MKILLSTFVFLASLSSQAAEIIIKSGNKVFVLKSSAEISVDENLSEGGVIDLLRNAELTEVQSVEARPGTWTESAGPARGKTVNSWTESAGPVK